MKRLLLITAMLAIIALALVGCGITAFITYDNADEYIEGAGAVDGEITDLEIEWPAGKVVIRYHDGEGAIIGEEGLDAESTPLYYRFKSGELSVKYAKSGVIMSGLSGKDLTVSLPSGTSLSSLEVNTQSASVDASSISVNEAKISTASGRVVLTDCEIIDRLDVDTASGGVSATLKGYCQNIDVDTASGSIDICCDAGSFSADSASGRITLRVNNLPTEIDAQSTSGSVNVYLPDTASFSFEARSVSGRVNCEFESTKDGDKYTVNGGNTDYSFKTVSGNIYIAKS